MTKPTSLRSTSINIEKSYRTNFSSISRSHNAPSLGTDERCESAQTFLRESNQNALAQTNPNGHKLTGLHRLPTAGQLDGHTSSMTDQFNTVQKNVKSYSIFV